MNMHSLCIGLIACFLSLPLFAQAPTDTREPVTHSPAAARDLKIISTTATVADIDKASREIKLKRENGETISITAGDEVRNFDQIKVGDVVTAQYVQALSLELHKGGAGSPEPSDRSGMVSRKEGALPGAAVGAAVTMVADVMSVNQDTQTVSLRGPEGNVVDLLVSDPERLNHIEKGDRVQATYAEAVAVAVNPQPALEGSSGN